MSEREIDQIKRALDRIESQVGNLSAQFNIHLDYIKKSHEDDIERMELKILDLEKKTSSLNSKLAYISGAIALGTTVFFQALRGFIDGNK